MTTSYAEAKPVAYKYRWKVDGEYVNWRYSDGSNYHGSLDGFEEIPLYAAPAPAKRPQCCMCGKIALSTVEGDGGTECELSDGRWVCSAECWERAVEPPVTREEAIKFLEGACRNWSKVPRLSNGDLDDVATELSRFRHARRAALSTSSTPADGEDRAAPVQHLEGIHLTLTRALGMYGAAYDPPGPHRAYTYEHQPANGVAWNLGCAVSSLKQHYSGDAIDVGLYLLKEMQARGLGVFEIEPKAIEAAPPQSSLTGPTDEQRFVGIGMAIAAGIVMKSWGNDTYVREILGAAGLDTLEKLKACGVDQHDIDILTPALATTEDQHDPR